MSWIKITLISLLCVASLTYADTVEFFSDSTNKAHIDIYPVFSPKTVASLEGDFFLPTLERKQVQDGFTEVTVSGMASLGQIGRPSLPTTGALIAVPAGYRPQITIISKEDRVLNDVWIAPYQAKARCDCNQGALFKFDTAVYDQTNLFPSEFIQIETVGSLQSLKFARIALHPIQFNPETKSLNVTYRLKFRVDFVQEHPGTTQSLPKGLFHLAKTWAVNGKSLGTSVVANPAQEKLLIVSPEKLKKSLTSFIEWKTQKGLAVDYVSFEKAGGSKEALKKFIQDYYQAQKLKPTYLLLVGNAESLPPFLENTTTGGGEQIAASDYPYSLVDGKDPIPDLLYGRLLADNEQEVLTQTSRWIQYEKSPESNIWYSRGTVIGSDESGAAQSDEQYVTEIAQNLKKYSYKQVDEFFQGKKTATTSNILGAVQEGRSWITYMGHGSGLGWASTNDNFDVNALSALNNERLPFILDISCANADYIKHPRPFGKAWVTQENSGKNVGAVAYYGGSVNISWDPPAIMAVGISKAHFEKPVHHLGGTVLAGQIYLSEQKGTGDEFIDNLRWYQLFGDPSMELRTALPARISLKQNLTKKGKSYELSLTASDEDSKPIVGALASISLPNSFQAIVTGKTDVEGQVKLKIDGEATIARGVITIAGYNLTPLIQSIKR